MSSEARAWLSELMAEYGTDGILLIDSTGRPRDGQSPARTSPTAHEEDQHAHAEDELSTRLREYNHHRRLFGTR